MESQNLECLKIPTKFIYIFSMFLHLLLGTYLMFCCLATGQGKYIHDKNR